MSVETKKNHNNDYLDEQMDHRQVFNGIGIDPKSRVSSLGTGSVNVARRVDFEPRRL